MARAGWRVLTGVGVLTTGLVAAGLVLPRWQPPADAVGATPGYPSINGPSSTASGGLSTNITIGNFTLADASASGSACGIGTVRAVISTNLGTITASQPTGGSISGSGTTTVTLTGSVANVEASLDAATVNSSSAGSATITTSLRPNDTFTSGSDSYVFGNTTGHYYRVFNNGSSVSWATMRTNAAATSFCGAGGYLTTITTSDERTSIQSLSSYAAAAYWLGAVRSSSSSAPNGSACTTSSCLWYWDPGTNAPSGEQAGRMSYGDPGNPPSTNIGLPWHSGEPNNSGPFLALSPASSVYNWDDVASGNNLQYGLIEFGNNTTYTIASVTSTVAISACTATTTNYTGNGTNGVNGARYRVVTFTSGAQTACASTWSAPSSVSSIDVLVVGGGAGGGSDAGGGGGGGGVRERTGLAVTGGSSYAVTVGAGGSGARCPRNADYNTSDNCDPRSLTTYDAAGSSGGSSVFDSITSLGGGGGGSKYVSAYASNAPGDGVSGASGGGGGHPSSQPGGSGTYSSDGDAETRGNDGGTSSSGSDYAGGGGGAGAAGSAGSASAPGAGGAGYSSTITGTATEYGAGGGGGRWSSGSVASGGSGAGTGANNSSAATAGTNGRGGGGGGGGNVGAGYGLGGVGGSGVVILRYRIDISATTTDQDSSTSSSTDLAFGKVGSAYSQALTFTGGVGPTFSYSVVTGSLPAGLSLDGATGRTLTISGTPTTGGISTFTVRATDADSGNIATDQQVTIAISDLVMPSLILADPRAAAVNIGGPSTLAGGSKMAVCVFASDGTGAAQNVSTLRTDTSTSSAADSSATVNSHALSLTNDYAYGEFKVHGSTADDARTLLSGTNALRVARSSGLASTFTLAVKAIPYWSSVPSCSDSNGGTITQVVQVKPLGIKRNVTSPITVN